LAGSPRLVLQYPWQEEAGLHVYVDTDFAGCTQTRRSTSGGILFLGTHPLKHWSATQKYVTLSSGEAELGGVVKGVAEGLGAQALAADLGMQLSLSVHADSSAAIGICRRSGIGRVRHLAVGQLWVQDHLRRGTFQLFKVRGEENPADLCTKHLVRAAVDRLLEVCGLVRESGRADSAPRLSVQADPLPTKGSSDSTSLSPLLGTLKTLPTNTFTRRLRTALPHTTSTRLLRTTSATPRLGLWGSDAGSADIFYGFQIVVKNIHSKMNAFPIDHYERLLRIPDHLEDALLPDGPVHS
jgi:hypothetical protein